jgi:hypothetical protein
MIEKDIEAKIVAAVEALGLPGLVVRGAWQAAAAGEVKDEESDRAPAALFVHVGPRSFESYSSPEVTFPVTLSFAIRVDLNPTGAALETYCDPVAGFLHRWNLDIAHGSGICELDVSGFNTHFIQFTGGDGPTFENDAKIWSVVFNLTVGGVVSRATSQTTTQEES